MLPAHIKLANFVEGLSLAVDLAEEKPLQHAQDVSYLALRMGESLGLASAEMNVLFFAALLHDITITTNGKFCPLCETVKEYSLSHLIQEVYDADKAIHNKGEAWDGSGPKGLAGDNIPTAAKILTLAVDTDLAGGDKRHFWNWRSNVEENIRRGRGNRYDPRQVDVLKGLLRDRQFCLDIFDPNYKYKIERYRPATCIEVDSRMLEILGKTFAFFIDQKTPYTANHSREVANVSYKMAQALNLDGQTSRAIYLAGLLHDLGKITVPNSILEKSDPLTGAEFNIVKNHSYYSALILERIPELSSISLWAAAHHEKLDGSGYFIGMKEKEIPLEARLIAVADILAALAADRPYRKSLNRAEITKIMQKMAMENQIDKMLVDVVLNLFTKQGFELLRDHSDFMVPINH